MRKKCTIRIELLSDMCVSDGSSYNSLLDTDICSDRSGFPYIPAKRLRGCLRECAVELNDWRKDTVRDRILFGDEGNFNNEAQLRIGNAYLEDYLEMRAFVSENQGHALVHPQNILSAFSYIRTQTSVNYDTGVADDNSLRTIRVADKGLVFIAEAEVEEDFHDELATCCKVLRHMGIARTRGLGEVKVSLEDGIPVKQQNHAALSECATELKYEIELLEPVICKSVNGGESNTLDYIEGAKILGLISRGLGESGISYLDFMSKGELKCSNAYIVKNNVRYTEVPGYIYKIKNDKNKYVNKLVEDAENNSQTEKLQLNQMKHCYISMSDGKLEKADVMTEERYHHRRPEDKSRGRAAANEGSDADFYQMDSISEGQCFAGSIIGSEAQIRDAYKILSADRYFYIGYSKSSEYGKVRIRITSTGNPSDIGMVSTNSIVAVLSAPAIIYSDNAMSTTDPEILANEILASLGIEEEPASVNRFIRNTTLGGFNVTWGKRKPTLQAFDKGTALKLNFAEPVKAPADAVAFIGERTSEGYGEIHLVSAGIEDAPYIGEIIKSSVENESKTIDASSDFARKLATPILDAFIRRRAAEAVMADSQTLERKKSVYKPTVSNMMLMYKESDSVSEIEASVKERYSKKSGTKEEKREAAEYILARVDEAGTIIEDFCRETHISRMDADVEDIKMKFLREYLIQVKYILKGGESNA